MTKKIFFTDLDETLLTTGKDISPATKDILKKMAEAGHYIVLASGRPYPALAEVRRLLPIPDESLFFSVCNGAQVIEGATGKSIHEQGLTLDDARYFLDYCQKKGIHGQTYQNDLILSPGECAELDAYRRVIHIPVVIAQDICSALVIPPLKCVALSLSKEPVLENLAHELTPWAGDRIKLVRSSPMILECFNSKAGKDSSIRFLSGYLGIPISDIMAAGDQENDIDMIKTAGVGVAMINGVESVKRAADMVTQSDNNHDGLVPLLKDFFGV